MTPCIRLAVFPLAALALLLIAACTDPVDRVGDASGDPPPAAELNARVQAWRDGLESVAETFRTTYFAQDGSVESLTLGEFRIHFRDRWLWNSSIRERSRPGARSSDDPGYLAVVDGRIWQSFDPGEGWFAPEGSEDEMSDEDWDLFLTLYASAAIDVEPIPDDADVAAAELHGRDVWAAEYAQVKPGGMVSGSGPDGDYRIDLRLDEKVTVFVDPASGAPLRRITASRRWDGDADLAEFRSNWSIQVDLASWNSDPAKPVIAPVLTEDEARRIALPNRYRDPDERRPPQADDGGYPADQAAFSLDELRTALVRWTGGLDTLRTTVERREFGPAGELTGGSDLDLLVNFRERWSRAGTIQVGSGGEPIPASRRQSLVTPEGRWEAFDPELGWRVEPGYPGWESLGKTLVEAVGIDFDLVRAEYRGSALLDDGRAYVSLFVPQDPDSWTARGSALADEPAREYRFDDTIHLYFDPETGALDTIDIFRLEWDVEDRSGARDTSVVTKYRVLEWNAEVERPAPEPELSRSEYERALGRWSEAIAVR